MNFKYNYYRYVLSFYLLVIRIVNSQRPSPCPTIFKYESVDLEGGQWTGIASLTTIEELTGVWLNVGLDQTANVLINWFGESTTRDNKAFVIKNPSKLLKPGESPLDIKFRIQYDVTSTVPSLERLRLNGRTICSRPSTTTTPSTKTTTVYYSERVTEKNIPRATILPQQAPMTNQSAVALPQSSSTLKQSSPTLTQSSPTLTQSSSSLRNVNKSNTAPDYFQGDFLIQNNLNGRPNQSRRPTLDPTNQCGRVILKARPLITYGESSSDGRWPWHLAIYHSEGVYLNYICGGSIISKEYVVTAAHCVTRPRTKEPTNLNGLLLYLGTTNLKQFGPGTQVHQIGRAHVHPEYNPSNLYNDVALLKLQRPIEFNNYVRPICLWEGDSDIRNLENKLGTVVGWGYNEENQITDNLMHIKMPVVSLATCIFSNRDFFSTFTFEKNYCAGYRNGTSVCNGDSGGGMYFTKNDDADVWQIRGLVSIGVALQGKTCNPSHYVIFTDLAKHLDWIKETMQ